MVNYEAITDLFREHHIQKFKEYGATVKGVDWGREEDVELRYGKMLEVLGPGRADGEEPASLLDVGCGYGGLYEYARSRNIRLRYTGIDVVEPMVEYASGKYPGARFFCEDILKFSPEEPFDYVVCNGVLTQKLAASILDMGRYAREVIAKMFRICNKGVAFNLMTTRVNYMADNLYYEDPAGIFAYCLSEITGKARVDHAYSLHPKSGKPFPYEYTVYLYK